MRMRVEEVKYLFFLFISFAFFLRRVSCFLSFLFMIVVLTDVMAVLLSILKKRKRGEERRGEEKREREKREYRRG